MPEADFIAIDWGTTNRRIYLIDGKGEVLQTERDNRGALTVTRGEYPEEVARIRARFGDLDILCAGMVGSNRGWAETPYVSCPADIAALASALFKIDARTTIVPGLALNNGRRVDVMRGEEVQFLGAVSAGLAPKNARLCQPGTHSKWARTVGGVLQDFRTSMTGEMFALLKQHSLLSHDLTGPVADDAAFRSGLEAALDGKLLGDLFEARAASLLGLRQNSDTASYISGLLIGSDVREQSLEADATVYLLADQQLGTLYASALANSGLGSERIESTTAFVAGITAIRRIDLESR